VGDRHRTKRYSIEVGPTKGKKGRALRESVIRENRNHLGYDNDSSREDTLPFYSSLIHVSPFQFYQELSGMFSHLVKYQSYKVGSFVTLF
jgi:hypothetical protein